MACKYSFFLKIFIFPFARYFNRAILVGYYLIFAKMGRLQVVESNFTGRSWAKRFRQNYIDYA
jgi:hypothetical protein